MTVAGAQRLKVELHRLKTIERPAVIMAIADARSHGDLSENADYDAAKERQGFIEGRISELESKLGNMQVIDPATLDGARAACTGMEHAGELRPYVMQRLHERLLKAAA